MIRMNIQKVIITKQKRIANDYFFENEVGLSSYDLALIAIDKITKKNKLYTYDSSKTTYLI